MVDTIAHFFKIKRYSTVSLDRVRFEDKSKATTTGHKPGIGQTCDARSSRTSSMRLTASDVMSMLNCAGARRPQSGGDSDRLRRRGHAELHGLSRRAGRPTSTLGRRIRPISHTEPGEPMLISATHVGFGKSCRDGQPRGVMSDCGKRGGFSFVWDGGFALYFDEVRSAAHGTARPCGRRLLQVDRADRRAPAGRGRR